MDASFGSSDNELSMLKSQADVLEREMKAIRDRIAQLENQSG
jgi:hypothetical protein